MNDSDKTKEQLIAELQQMRLAYKTCQTKLKGIMQSEKLLKDIIDHNPVSIQILDKEGFTISVNKAFVELFGITPTPDISMFADMQLMLQGLRDDIIRLQNGEVVHFQGTYYNPYKRKIEFPNKQVYVEAVGFPIFKRSKGRPERYVLMHVDLTEIMNKEVEARKLNEQLRQMSLYQEEVRDDERRKLARDLHDDFSTTLIAIKLRLELLKQRLNNAADINEINLLVVMITDVTTAIGKIVADLRSVVIEDLGLKTAVATYLEDFALSNNIKVYAELDDDLDFGGGLSFVVFKILKSAMSNVVRHSGATTVDVWLTRNHNQLELIISDNGKGIDPKMIKSNKSFGLIGMRERTTQMNGKFSIDRGSNFGTMLTFKFPLSEKTHP